MPAKNLSFARTDGFPEDFLFHHSEINYIFAPTKPKNHMKKILKFLGIILGIVLLAVLGFVTFIEVRGLPSYEAKVPDIKQVEVTPQRVARGEKLASMLCFNCHYNGETGKFTGRALAEVPQFGAINSRNITQDKENGIGKWTDAQLIYFLRTGIHPFRQKYIPPYMVKLAHISDEDMYSIVAFLHSDDPRLQASNIALPQSEPSFLTKFLCFVAFKPFPFPEKVIADPDTNNAVEWGKYIALNQVECFSCHSKDFKTNDYFNPEKSEGFFGGGNIILDPEGKKMVSLNLTQDEETGLGKWSEEDFTKALRTGVVPGGLPPLRNPMIPFPRFTDNEVKAIWAYLKSVPKLKHKVERAG